MKQPKLSTLADKLWKITRQIVFLTYGTHCYTCPAINLEGRNLQCGHGYPDGALGTRMAFDMRILRAQCARCNLWHNGMGAVFWDNLRKEYGDAAADQLLLECQQSKGKPTKARDFYLEEIPKREQQLQELKRV